jgi:hypothetical protein
MVLVVSFKPHKTLDGQTPAEVAGVGIEAENKWMELLKRACAKDRKP